jgi:N-acetylglutamate synthase-like GNAT family acetyltransferase
MTIRLAEEHDAEAISATLQAAFAEFETLYTPAAFSATTPTTDQILERFAEGPIWIAEVSDMIVGTVATVPQDTDVYIRSMAVRPEARGSGIGAGLLNTVEALRRRTWVSPVAAQYGAVLIGCSAALRTPRISVHRRAAGSLRNAAAHDGEGCQDRLSATKRPLNNARDRRPARFG